jgi:peptide/nickel transport system substrate-binding protein
MRSTPRGEVPFGVPSLVSRRSLLVGAALAIGTVGRDANARGRSRLGGRVALRVPWPLASLDPHRVDDAAAAIFGNALFDTLYVVDEHEVTASLAEASPEPDGDALRVRLREGVRTARGHKLDARDVVASIARARSQGARGWLAELPTPHADKGGATIRFATKDAPRLMRALASRLVAIVPAGFRADRPDGTGPFRADLRAGALTLTRNAFSARGAAWLDEIVVREASDVSDSLRSFETGADDVGWLGTGLHEPRAGAVVFDAGGVAFAVLRTGRDAGAAWDAPGVAQSICDGISYSVLSSLVLGAAWPAAAPAKWGGPPCDLLVRDDARWLIELAKAIAGSITDVGHEVTAKPVGVVELAQRRSSRGYALALDVARPAASTTLGALGGLAACDDPATAADVIRHAPRLGEVPPRALTKLMRIGVVGEIRVQGGRTADVVLPSNGAGDGVDWGGASRARR